MLLDEFPRPPLVPVPWQRNDLIDLALHGEPSEVIKKDGKTKMTCKAFNGRVITEWLASCLRSAAEGHCCRNADERIPLAAACMPLCWVTLHEVWASAFQFLHRSLCDMDQVD